MSKMGSGVKRGADQGNYKAVKKLKVHKNGAGSQTQHSAIPKRRRIEEQQDESDEVETMDEEYANDNSEQHPSKIHAIPNAQTGKDSVLNGQSSREAHAKQKALSAERRAAKPNADKIARTKKIWERLRIKSAVPKEEREKLVSELFGIITGRVKEFVFKHDSVRVIQCALKYSTPEQKRQIAKELQGNYRELAESKYAKFLIAKLVVGDNEIRDLVVPEFYGHVKRLMRHPEGSWIVDDIYRGLATKAQKARLLREWYGAEFVMFPGTKEDKVSADLSKILEESPEKRGPIMQHLKEMTNQLVQKKTTGFTMLHDALLQYFINTKPGSPEATEFLEMLKDDEEGDLYKNLAFTRSGSRIVCLALAYGNSKDRRTILKFFKTHIKLLSGDNNGHVILLAAYEVIDDTVMTSKAIFPELLSKDLSDEERTNEMLGQVTHLTARIPLLYLLAPEPPKWLLTDEDISILHEVKEVRKETSKKDPETRRVELLKTLSQPLLDLVSTQTPVLIESSFGCQYITEVLLGAFGEKQSALEAVASFAKSDAQDNTNHLASPHAGRMLKMLVQGGRFDQTTKQIQPVEPSLGFGDILYKELCEVPEGLISWATSAKAFTIVAMLEAADFNHREGLQDILLKHRKQLETPLSDSKATNAGTRIILEKLGGVAVSQKTDKPKKSKSRR